jgi:hypothetical protein
LHDALDAPEVGETDVVRFGVPAGQDGDEAFGRDEPSRALERSTEQRGTVAGGVSRASPLETSREYDSPQVTGLVSR